MFYNQRFWHREEDWEVPHIGLGFSGLAMAKKWLSDVYFDSSLRLYTLFLGAQIQGAEERVTVYSASNDTTNKRSTVISILTT